MKGLSSLVSAVLSILCEKFCDVNEIPRIVSTELKQQKLEMKIVLALHLIFRHFKQEEDSTAEERKVPSWGNWFWTRPNMTIYHIVS